MPVALTKAAVFLGSSPDSSALKLLYMCQFSLLCPVLSLNRIIYSGLFSLWRLFDCLKFGCCCLYYFLVRVLMNDGLFISVKVVFVLLVQLASFPSKPVCFFISLDPALC